MKQALTAISLLLLFAFTSQAKPLKAGFARAVITPEQPTWLSGYAARTKPSEGKLHDLHAKALALEDERGYRVVIVTTDLLGFSKDLAEPIVAAARKQYGLRREQLLLTSSHTHTAPVVRSNLIGAYALDEEQAARVTAYAKLLHERIVAVIGAAIRGLAPANISLAHGTGSFAINRRERTPQGTIKIGLNPQGVVDHDVPTLIVESLDGKLRGVFFAYACHNTTLTGENLAVSGDYAGFAQAAFESAHPNTTAMFAMGCGADINPNPRGTVELGQQHGNSLAAAVDKALLVERRALAGRFKTAFATIPLAYAKLPSREELKAMQSDSSGSNVFKQRLATRWLARLDREGKLPTSYPYPIHALQLGANFTLIALGGEVVTDYALRLKKELGAQGLMVLGYANEVMAYIPSARMYQEGGYEVVDSMIYYDHPTTWTPALEEQIVEKAKAMAAQVGRRR